MPINSKCLARLQQLGLPMVVDAVNLKGKIITQARIDLDGRTTDLSTHKVYDQPSAFRQAVVAKNTATYKYLIYQGKSLTAHGVKP